MFYRLMLCLCLVVLGAVATPAQRTRQLPVTVADGLDDDDRGGRLGRPEDEMLKRRRVEHEKKEYQNHLARAHEAATLGATLKTAFEQRKVLSPEDFKKLERLAKLARGIRKNMSEESDALPLENPPATLADGLTRLAREAEELETQVKETPRNVVSAVIVEKACEVEALARYLRETWEPKEG